MRFRRHNVEQLAKTAPHLKDEAKLIAVAKQARQQLEELFAQERDESLKRQALAGWSREDEAPETAAKTPPAA